MNIKDLLSSEPNIVGIKNEVLTIRKWNRL